MRLPEAGSKPTPPILFSGNSDIASHPMKLVREQQRVLGCFSVLLLLSGCGDVGPECGAPDTRDSIVRIVSDNHNNALLNFAAKNSSAVAAMVDETKSEAEKLAAFEKAKAGAVYTLYETVRMTSVNKATRTASCTGVLAVTVADTTAEKELEYKVQQTADGKSLVSVSPFLF
jgi:hypothetical protein